MKSIKYIIILAFTSSILMSALPLPSHEMGNSISLKCSENNVNPDVLKQTSKIIEQRILDYGINNYELSISLINEPTIQIRFNEAIDMSQIEKLVASNGRLAFYETIDRAEFIQQMDTDGKLNRLKNTLGGTIRSSKLNSKAEIGVFSDENRLVVEKQISFFTDKAQNNSNYFLFWGRFYSENEGWPLYVLHRESLLDGSLIEQVKVNKNETNSKPEIQLSFSKEGAKLWQAVTARKVGKNIAVVMDDEVLIAPFVREEITRGTCIITGDLSSDTVKLLMSLIQNGALPADMQLIE